MVNYGPNLDAVFHALADPTRREMVARLCQGPATVGELGEPFAMTKPAVTKHVKVLERAGLLVREIDGRVHRCEVDVEPLSDAQQWVAEIRAFWGNRFDDLADHLDAVQRKGKRNE